MSHATIGSTLRERRKDAGYTQDEVAKVLGVNQTMVLQIERGTKQLSLLNAAKLAELFGCSIDDLLGGGPHERKTGNA